MYVDIDIACTCCHVHADLGFDVKSGLSKSYKPTLAQHGLRCSSKKDQEYGMLVYINQRIKESVDIECRDIAVMPVVCVHAKKTSKLPDDG